MEGGDLVRLWKGGKKGCLSPLMQAKAWGLSEAGVRNRCSSYAAEEMVLHQLYDKVLTFINEMIDAA